MKKKFLLLFSFIGFAGFILVNGQNYSSSKKGVDASLFWKKSGEYVNRIESENGILYLRLGHHGPAIENLWVAYRVYFNDFGGVDLFSKFQPRLELKSTKWYASKLQKENGFGSDNYAAGKTTGLGGIKIWDGTAVMKLGPVNKRIAEVFKNDSLAQIKITSFSIPYKGNYVDLEFTLTTFSNTRHAVIEIKELTGTPVELVTGMPIHSKLRISTTDHFILAWGDYDSHEKHAVFNVGTALLYNPADFQQDLITEKEHLFISKPTTYLKYIITSSNDKENSELNNYTAFEDYVQQLQRTFIWN